MGRCETTWIEMRQRDEIWINWDETTWIEIRQCDEMRQRCETTWIVMWWDVNLDETTWIEMRQCDEVWIETMWEFRMDNVNWDRTTWRGFVNWDNVTTTTTTTQLSYNLSNALFTLVTTLGIDCWSLSFSMKNWTKMKRGYEGSRQTLVQLTVVLNIHTHKCTINCH